MKICNPFRRAAWVLALSTCATAPALATDSGFYLSASIGQSTYDVDDDALQLFPIVSGSNTDDTDLAFSLSFGYRILPFLGVELSLNDFGELDYTETGFISASVGGYADAKVGTRGLSLAAVGILPVQNFEFFGKVGALLAETKINGRVASTFGSLPAGTTGVAQLTANTTAVLYTLGVGYNVSEAFNINVDWTLVPQVGKEADLGTDVDVDVLSVGFQYRF